METKSSSKSDTSSQRSIASSRPRENSSSDSITNKLNKSTQMSECKAQQPNQPAIRTRPTQDSAISKFVQQQDKVRSNRVNAVLSPCSKSTKLSASINQQATAVQALAASFPQFKFDLNQLAFLSNLLMSNVGDLCKESNNNSLNVKDRNRIDFRQRLKPPPKQSANELCTNGLDNANLERIKQESEYSFINLFYLIKMNFSTFVPLFFSYFSTFFFVVLSYYL